MHGGSVGEQGDKMPNEYPCDAVAGPLLTLERLVAAIHDKLFNPIPHGQGGGQRDKGRSTVSCSNPIFATKNDPDLRGVGVDASHNEAESSYLSLSSRM